MHLDITTVLIRLFQISYEILFKTTESLLLEDLYKHILLRQSQTSNTSSKRVRSVSGRNSGTTLVLQQKDQELKNRCWHHLKMGCGWWLCPSTRIGKQSVKTSSLSIKSLRTVSRHTSQVNFIISTWNNSLKMSIGSCCFLFEPIAMVVTLCDIVCTGKSQRLMKRRSDLITYISFKISESFMLQDTTALKQIN